MMFLFLEESYDPHPKAYRLQKMNHSSTISVYDVRCWDGGMVLKKFASYVKGSYSGLSPAVWFFSLVTLVNRAGTMVLPFLTLYINRDLGYSITFAGKCLGMYGGGAVVGSWLGGWLADRIGVMRTILISFVGTGMVFLVLEHVRTKPLLIGILFLLGVIGEAYRPAASTAIALFCKPENMARAYALQRLAINLGMTVGPALGGFLAERSYVWLFRVDSATCLLASLLLVFLPLKQFFVQPPPVEKALKKAHSPLRDRGYLLFLFLAFLSAVAFFQLFSVLPLYLNDSYGITESGFGLLIAVNCIMITFCEMTLTRFVEDMKPLRVVGVGSFCVGLGYFILPFGHGASFALLFIIIWTVGEMLTGPIMSTYVANRTNNHNRGAYMGLLSVAFSFGYIVGPMAGTHVYQNFGGLVLWTACFVLGIFNWAGFELLGIRDRLAASKV